MSTSSAAKAVVRYSWNRSVAATVRSPFGPRSVTSPSLARSTAGRSDAGSPCETDPPIVPRLRTCWSAMVAAAFAASPRSGVSCTRACRVIAPIRHSPFVRSMPSRPGTRRRSTSSDGDASRSFISGSSECPPARSLASSPPSDSSRMASSSDSGAA